MKLFIVIILFFSLFLYEYFIQAYLFSIKRAIRQDQDIPNIVFRTISTRKQVWPIVSSCHEEWIRLNPEYSFIWYTNKDCDRFMLKYFSGPVNNAYNKLIPGAYKADLWRLCILYRFGGIYIDAFATPYVSIDNMRKPYKFISVLDCSSAGLGIHNGFMIASRRHPFLKEAINNIVKNVEEEFYGQSSLEPTGPLLLSKTIETVTHIKPKFGDNNTYYLFKLEWGPYQHVYDKDIILFSKYFSALYFFYRKWFSTGYSRLWKSRKIYKTITNNTK